MARFDIHPNPIEPDRDEFPYVLEIQSDLLYQFAERVCIPLAYTFPGMTQRFNPAVSVAGETLRLHPLGMAVFFNRELGLPVAHAKAEAMDIETAIDMLLRGY
jgi:toxin CcdB